MEGEGEEEGLNSVERWNARGEGEQGCSHANLREVCRDEEGWAEGE